MSFDRFKKLIERYYKKIMIEKWIEKEKERYWG